MGIYQKIFFLLIGVSLCWGPLSAADDSPQCFKQLQRNFFRYSTVSLALSYYPNNVNQNQWEAISQALQRRNQVIPRAMRDQARRMRPNPLGYPFDSEAAEHLFRQIVWNVFVDAMVEQNITNPVVIEGVFRFIYQQESKRLKACLGVEIR